MYDLVTFGEMLLRLGPPGFQRIEQAGQLDVSVTGGETNATTIAARFGLKTAHVTRLPNNPLGKMIENKLREHGIDTSHFVWTGDGRVGLFFLEQGAMPRTGQVVYDRAHSAMSQITPGEIDWKKIFPGTRLFHTTGTAPAISDSAAAVVLDAVKQAKAHNVTVSLDINYRAKLWTIEKCRSVIFPMLAHCDILICGVGDTDRIFGVEEKTPPLAAEALARKFNLKVVVLTMRNEITVWQNEWTAIAYHAGTVHTDVTYAMEIVDRVGGGDAFTGGFLWAYLTQNGDIGTALKYGNAACALKHSFTGDLCWSTLAEVEELIARGPTGSLRIKR